jgi:hypothetical protein
MLVHQRGTSDSAAAVLTENAREEQKPGAPQHKAAAPGQHVLAHLVASTSVHLRFLRYGSTAVACLLGVQALYLCWLSLSSPYVYGRDFLQEYLLARAVADGNDPYLPVRVLAEHYLGEMSVPVFFHPSPHPPTVGLLLLPLAFVDFGSAIRIWLAIELVLLGSAIYLLGRSLGGRFSPLTALATALALIAWGPVFTELIAGQLMIALLFLLAAAALALRSDRPMLGGLILGLAVLVKPVPWPILLLLTVRRDWRILGVSLLTILVGYGIAIWMVGLDRLLSYFTRVLPVVTETYKVSASNLSLWTLGWRIFHGLEEVQVPGIVAPPLVVSESGAAMLAALLPFLVTIACLLASRHRDPDSQFALLTCASILTSPIAWNHYLVLAIIPAALIIARLAGHRFPRGKTNAALLVAMLLIIPEVWWLRLGRLVSGQVPIATETSFLPFAPALLTLMPTLAVGALGLLVLQSSTLKRADAQAAPLEIVCCQG